MGIERDTGFAFAQGEVDKWRTRSPGDEGEAFVPSGGVGLIPGTTILTSVIQVNLDPRGAAFKAFLNRGSDPRGAYSHTNPVSGAQYIIDTGSFYLVTDRLAGLALGVRDEARLAGPRLPRPHPHARGGGRPTARRASTTSASACSRGGARTSKSDSTIKSINLEGFFGVAVYYGVGSGRACCTLGGTTLHPIYTKFDAPTGYFREEMKTSNLYPGSLYSGPFLPILDTPSKGLESGISTINYRNPANYDTLNALQSRQRHNLKYSLVSAYVRRQRRRLRRRCRLAVAARRHARPAAQERGPHGDQHARCPRGRAPQRQGLARAAPRVGGPEGAEPVRDPRPPQRGRRQAGGARARPAAAAGRQPRAPGVR